MRSNGLLKWLMVPMLALLVYVGIKVLSRDRPAEPAAAITADKLTPDEAKALGISGDTPRDTVATLVAQVKQLRGELQTALAENKQHKAENDRLRAREHAVDQRIENALQAERSRSQQERDLAANERQQAQGLLQDLQRRLDGMGSKKTGDADLPVGLGLDDGNTDGSTASPAPKEQRRWIEPADAKPAGRNSDERKDSAFSKPFEMAEGVAEVAGDGVEAAGAKIADATSRATGASARPVYTVPANATLTGSVAMTALIGRVPVDGTVNDPYPFKVVIGPDNLTANGIELPGVAGAVASGTASGDWTLSCVRGQIRSLTFVFHDGTIRTVPEDAGEERRESKSSQAGLGWISDPHGIPCVSGERRSNARQYLGTQALITAAGAAAASMSKGGSGSMTIASQDGGSLGSARVSGNQALEQILVGGVQDVSQWAQKLYGQAFAAVYVQPSAQVAVHIERPLHIDHDTKGRKVDHGWSTPHATELD